MSPNFKFSALLNAGLCCSHSLIHHFPGDVLVSFRLHQCFKEEAPRSTSIEFLQYLMDRSFSLTCGGMGDHVTTTNLRIGLEILQLTTLQAGRSAMDWLPAIDDMGPYVSTLDICLQYSLEIFEG